MKKIIAIILLSIPFFCFSQEKRHKFNFDFALIFGGCFHNDSVSINLNGVNIISNVILETNIVGSANFSVSQDRNNLLVKSQDKITKLKRIDLKQPLNFQIFVNNRRTEFTFSIKNGRVLYAENCPIEGDSKRVKVLKVIQQDSPVMFF